MRLFTVILAGTLTLAAARPASADWMFTPYVGGVFGGSARLADTGDASDEFERRVTFGGSLAWMGAGIAGFEVDFGFTPNFFENTRGPVDYNFGESNVTTLMANLILGVPIGGQEGLGVRPYAAGGIGLLRAFAEGDELLGDDLNTNDLGINLGAGIGGFFSDHVGLRGDLRYFRSLQDRAAGDDLELGLGHFNFWRGTAGVMFRW